MEINQTSQTSQTIQNFKHKYGDVTKDVRELIIGKQTEFTDNNDQIYVGELLKKRGIITNLYNGNNPSYYELVFRLNNGNEMTVTTSKCYRTF